VCGAWFISTPPPSPTTRPAPPRLAVVAVRPVERVDDRRAHERADPPGGDQRVRRLDHGPEALLEADTEQPARAVGGIDHRVGLAHLDGKRLLAEHVRARLERLDRQRRMRRVRRADHDHIRHQREQLVVAHVLRVQRADADQLDVVELADRLQVPRRDHTRADHAVAQRHVKLTPSARSEATQSRVASSPLPSRW
jgi:hypothetical protein